MVVIVNVADVAPERTVTVDGRVAQALFDDKITTAPPDPAALLRVTVPVVVKPPEIEEGEIPRLYRLFGVIVRVPD